MNHIHRFQLPPQGEEYSPIGEVITGVCACGEQQAHRGIWTQDDEMSLRWRLDRKVARAMRRVLSQDYDGMVYP